MSANHPCVLNVYRFRYKNTSNCKFSPYFIF